MNPRTSVAAGLSSTLALALSMSLSLSACGGSSAEQDTTPAQPEPEPDPGLIPAEDLDSVNTFFERKSQIVTRCFSAGIDSGEIEPDVRNAWITVMLEVLPGGRAEHVRFPEASVKSVALEECLREHIDAWTLPEVSRSFEYSHRYGFSAL
ncbi:hypothetical protein [Haliangium ochraceum]|uniref:Lipoprotein n=1 Tax=Haliangium ochraceum (strain DSM 14365 / JCM 11303 / SMP-2) TaxID=502025 RepID=D0LYC7_HALO1|nr:hypothetical protein [Haliangium ochraceum]ACY16277.1 hypothetical protein Hoch_3777 [Haliangium ochraceum DSM 14365]